MAKYLNEEQKKEGKSYVQKNKTNKEKADKDLKSGKGFYGYFEGLEKPPKSKGSKPAELLELLNKIKEIKPFFRDKTPEMTPLTNYFYARYMASWLKNTGIAKSSLDMRKPINIGKKGNSADRYKMYCELIENVYGKEDDFLENLFPFDRVATVGTKAGMLQKQYGMLRAEERKKFRNISTKIKIPVSYQHKGKKSYGYTVAYYLEQYLKPNIKLNDLNRGMPLVLNKMDEPVFLEGGAYLISKGIDIVLAEDNRREKIESWYFGDDIPETDEEQIAWIQTPEYKSFENDEYLLRYMPYAGDGDDKYSHFIVEPDSDDPLSVFLKNDSFIATKKDKKWYTVGSFKWVSEGETFLPPNPQEYKSFEALGYLVESQMAHFATVSSETDKNEPGNTFEEVHIGLIGSKNRPGIAVYHANIFYHLLLAQARDPIANFDSIDQDIFAAGRLISIEAYLGEPLKILCYWLLSLRNYVEFKGINPNTETPNIVAPESISVSEAIIDERAKAEMTNALSKLQIAYYRCMFSMLKNKPFEYPKTLKAPREQKDKLGKDERKKFAEFADLSGLWSDLLNDLTTIIKGAKLINPKTISAILDYMYADGEGVITYPATMNPEIIEGTTDWGIEEVSKWLKFSYASNPTSIDTFIECASAVHASVGVTAYQNANSHVEGIKRFIKTVEEMGGYHYLIAILSEDQSDAIPDPESFRPKEVESYMPTGTRRNPSKLKKEAEAEQEYMVNIELELPVEVDFDNLPNKLEVETTKLFDRIHEGLDEEGIDEPAHIGTNGKILDLGWYVSGLDEAIDLLAHVTELYSELGIAGRGWLEWGQEEMRNNYTVDGYSFDDI